MELSSIQVVLIQTPGSTRANPLLRDLSHSEKIQISILPATMIHSQQDIHRLNIEIQQTRFKYFENREMRPPEIGCAYSHNLARGLISNTISGGVILEDDARITNLDIFIEVVNKFLLNQRGRPSVLNLTGLNFSTQDLPETQGIFAPPYFRILGHPSLAVGYALTAEAAKILRDANTPISTVSDWPASICRFYVTLKPLVLHGDGSTISTIEKLDYSFREGISLKHKLKLMSPKMILQFVNQGYGMRTYFKEVFYKRIAWRIDNVVFGLRLRINKWHKN